MPRTGSTWLAKELRGIPGVHVEFEPFTDAAAPQCGGRFFTQAIARSLTTRLRCVTRDFHAQPCYWAWQRCNASRLQARPSPTRTVVAGILLNPMYAPGAKWEWALTSSPHARLLWLRRTNLVKMALSDLRRLAGVASRHRTKANTTAYSGQTADERRLASQERLDWVDPRTLLLKVNMTLVSQASFPAGVALERGLLVVYEDLQAQRLLVMR